jgi:hypothetical protein
VPAMLFTTALASKSALYPGTGAGLEAATKVAKARQGGMSVYAAQFRQE